MANRPPRPRKGPTDPDAPLVLAIETSTRRASVALVRGPDLVAELSAPERPQSETLLPSIDVLLGQAGLTIHDVDAFAVAIGPGAFTGLRIGVTTAKAFAVAERKPVVAVSTLEVLAAGAGAGDAPVATVLDARRKEVWASLRVPTDGALRCALPERAAKPDAWAAEVRRWTEAEGQADTVAFVGDGVALYGSVFRDALGDRYAEAPRWAHAPRAAVLGFLAGDRLAAGETADPATLAPRYLRGEEAQVTVPGPRSAEPA